MRHVNLNRQLLGVEDFLFGVGKVLQTRAGQQVEITKINAGNLPFDETQSLAEWANAVNLYELGQIVEHLASIGNNLLTIIAVDNNKQNIDTVAGLNTELQAIYSNLSNILNVNSNETNINNLALISTDISTLADNVIALNSLYENLAAIQTNANNISAIVAIYNNLTNLNSVVTQLIPNLSEILLVDDKAIQVANDKTDVAAMKLAVETIYDTFDDRFLGSKLNDPLVDNDGNTLLDGAMYFNSSTNTLKVYDLGNTLWVTIPQLYLSGLLDVTLTSITTGDILTWNGSKWINTRTPSFDSIKLNGGTGTNGTTTWNNTEYTYDIVLNPNVTLQVGQEDLVYCKNNTSSIITNGRPVMASGTNGNSGNILVDLHDGTKTNAKRIVGITTEDLPGNGYGFVTRNGKVRGINTTGSQYGETWVDGDILYVKATGNLTKVEPLDTELKMPVAFVIHAHTNGTLYVRTTGIDENHDRDLIALKASLLNPKFNSNIAIGNAILSSWSSLNVMEGPGGTFFGTNGISSITGSNAYYDGTWRYKTDGSAGLQLVNKGNHQFRVASSGLAGEPITWETVADLSTSGLNVKPGTSTLPGFGFLGDLDTGMYNPNPNELGLVAGGVSKLNIKQSGAELDLTPSNSDNSKKIATTEFVTNKLSTIPTTSISLSGLTSYHLLQGNLAVSASTTTQGFNTTLYTGNGSTQSITTGIDMNTQWGNTPEEKFGGLVWIKARGVTWENIWCDTVRGSGKYIGSSNTSAQSDVGTRFTSFNNNGFTVAGTSGQYENVNTQPYVSWNFQTTHRVTGTTNHGQAYECHYNPFTGFTMVKYTGSGLAGHEIPHILGRKLDFVVQKNLTSTANWLAYLHIIQKHGVLNLTDAITYDTTDTPKLQTDLISPANGAYNTASNTYIMYGWANSYLDKSNKLIGNYEIGVYQGTGVAGNKITTRGKPAWVMIKRLDSTSNWFIHDNQRNNINALKDGLLFPNSTSVEDATYDYITFNTDGFTHNFYDANYNTSGGQYLYLVAYDTNANGGGSYYPLASDTANVQVNNALIPIAQGIDSNGAKNTILSKNETFSGVTYTSGKNYPYYDAQGNRGVSVHKPRYLESELVRTYAGESPDYFNVKENKWYSTNSGSELVTNGTFTSNVSGWTNGSGTATNVNGTLQVNGYTYWVYQDITVQIGKQYSFSFKYMNGGSNSSVSVGTTTELATYPYGVGSLVNTVISPLTSGIYTFKITPNTTTIRIAFAVSSSGAQVLNIDNVSLFEATITPTTEITNGRNYLNHIVYADNDGGVLYVEELPKIEYKDIVKANEFKGKNACTAWVNFDGTTTPPTIRDSYNVSAVIRTSTGVYDVYFKEDMDNTNYTTHSETYYIEGTGIASSQSKPISTKKCTINTGGAWVTAVYSSTPINFNYVSLYVQGGKN